MTNGATMQHIHIAGFNYHSLLCFSSFSLARARVSKPSIHVLIAGPFLIPLDALLTHFYILMVNIYI